MSPRLLHLVALAALTATLAAAVHFTRLRRALLTERAAHRLTDAAHHRELQHATRHHHAAGLQLAVLADADDVLDAALNTHHRPEGGHR
ncbi:hypothetical protein GCM10010449_84960 [Streptomyces rectiviolaceus]|uniref:Secreted protein n=1 Tax=Streptomyces rectiviolaceus TaxID=332591 RepID=A0ABP6NS62_9ACTN